VVVETSGSGFELTTWYQLDVFVVIFVPSMMKFVDAGRVVFH